MVFMVDWNAFFSPFFFSLREDSGTMPIKIPVLSSQKRLKSYSL